MNTRTTIDPQTNVPLPPLTTTPPPRKDGGHDPFGTAISKWMCWLLNTVLFLCDAAVDNNSAAVLGLATLPTLGVAAAASIATLASAHFLGISLRERRYGVLKATGAAVAAMTLVGGAGVIIFVSGIRSLHGILQDTGSAEEALGAPNASHAPTDPSANVWKLVLALQIGLYIAAMLVGYFGHSPFRQMIEKAEKRLRKNEKKLLHAHSDRAELEAERPKIIDTTLAETSAYWQDSIGRIRRAERWMLHYLKTPIDAGEKFPTIESSVPAHMQRDHVIFTIEKLR
jgi:hypothetical protein